MKILSTTSEIESSVEKIEIIFTDNNDREFTAEFTRRNNIKPLSKLMQSDDPYDHISLENQLELIDTGFELDNDGENELWKTARNYTPPAPQDNDSKTHAVIMEIDWNLLRDSKQLLLGIQNIQNLSVEQNYFMKGVLSLIDCLQNAVVEDGLFKEEEVFAAEGSNSIEPGCDSTVQLQSAMTEDNDPATPGEEEEYFIGYRDKNYPIRQITYYAKEEPAEIIHSLISTNELNDLLNYDGTSPDMDVVRAAVDVDNKIAFFRPEGEINGTSPQFVCKCLNGQFTDFVFTHIDEVECDKKLPETKPFL